MLDGRVEIIAGEIAVGGGALPTCFAHVADRNEVSRGLLWDWRAHVRRGTLRPDPPASFLPVHVACAAPTARSRPTDTMQPAPPKPPTAPADQIEIELTDGSRLRVGAEVSLVALRRVVAVLRG